MSEWAEIYERAERAIPMPWYSRARMIVEGGLVLLGVWRRDLRAGYRKVRDINRAVNALVRASEADYADAMERISYMRSDPYRAQMTAMLDEIDAGRRGKAV